jgi:hypothetical protein
MYSILDVLCLPRHSGKTVPKKEICTVLQRENYCPQNRILNFWAPFALQLLVLLSIYSTSVQLGLVS